VARRPGVPSLLRAMNDRSALELLLDQGPLTRATLGKLTGLSKVTASQLLARLEERGLVEVVGARSAGRGPSAELYAVVPGCAHAVGVDVGPDRVGAAVADVTGRVVAKVDLEAADDVAALDVVRAVVSAAVDRAGISTSRVSQLVIGTPGLVDPATGDVDFSWDLPRWRAGLRDTLRRDLGCGVTIENDVNLAAMAERAEGAARGVDDVLLLWVSRGVGLAVVLGGRLHRGATGAAGEIGYLPVPGVPLPSSVERPFKGAFQRLVGAEAVLELAVEHGVARTGSRSAAGAVETALDAGPRGAPFLDELARRLALGVAGACAVVDPALVVLAGEVGASGGERLCGLVSSAVGHIAPVHPRVVPTAVAEAPVLRGALLSAVDLAREALFASTGDT
jgi:predicted NBD/HSP70 family sugar kinase